MNLILNFEFNILQQKETFQCCIFLPIFFHICFKFSTKGQFLKHTKEHMFYETKQKKKNENEARSSVASPSSSPFPHCSVTSAWSYLILQYTSVIIPHCICNCLIYKCYIQIRHLFQYIAPEKTSRRFHHNKNRKRHWQVCPIYLRLGSQFILLRLISCKRLSNKSFVVLF